MYSWYNSTGIYFLNLEVLAFIILIFIFIYFLRKQWNQDWNQENSRKIYQFQGLANRLRFPGKKKKRSPSPHSQMEEKCRIILEKIYHKPFPSARPNFLKNPATGHNLELDCYNKDLKIALEYDGSQHSQYNPYFHRKGPQEFIYQTKKDDYKSLIVKQYGITLVRVPHWVPERDLEIFIRNKLREAGRL